ncbi:hypothetical protein ACF1G9_08970, partial [Streptomyces litmocidini]
MRSIITRKLLTAAAATGVLSLTGGFAVAANSTGDTPGPSTGHPRAPLSVSLCGDSVKLDDITGEAVRDLCAQAVDDPEGYGDGPDDETPDHPGENPAPPGHPTEPGHPTHPGEPTTPPTPPGGPGEPGGPGGPSEPGHPTHSG